MAEPAGATAVSGAGAGAASVENWVTCATAVDETGNAGVGFGGDDLGYVRAAVGNA